MKTYRAGSFNPTPITKFLIVIFLSANLGVELNNIFALSIVIFISLFFALNSRLRTAVKIVIFYLVLLALVYAINLDIPKFLKTYILFLAAVLKFFFLPFLAGKLLIATSDVSSIIVSLEKMKLPKVITIPVAVIFRYFPAFKNDKKYIKMAMKMRGITSVNPFKYLEYVSIPMLISASNIADDISKAAETKCISDPSVKTRYFEVKLGLMDLLFAAGIITLHTLGRVYA